MQIVQVLLRVALQKTFNFKRQHYDYIHLISNVYEYIGTRIENNSIIPI